MLTQVTYSQLLRDLATRHIDIRHSTAPKGCRYLKVVVAADPIQKEVNLANFYNKAKGTWPGDAPFVLHKAKDTDESRDEILTLTERIGHELLAAVCDFFRGPAGRRAGRVLQRTGMAADAIGPVGDNFYGTRFEFDFTESATQLLQFNPAKFLP